MMGERYTVKREKVHMHEYVCLCTYTVTGHTHMNVCTYVLYV